MALRTAAPARLPPPRRMTYHRLVTTGQRDLTSQEKFSAGSRHGTGWRHRVESEGLGLKPWACGGRRPRAGREGRVRLWTPARWKETARQLRVHRRQGNPWQRVAGSAERGNTSQDADVALGGRGTERSAPEAGLSGGDCGARVLLSPAAHGKEPAAGLTLLGGGTRRTPPAGQRTGGGRLPRHPPPCAPAAPHA